MFIKLIVTSPEHYVNYKNVQLMWGGGSKIWGGIRHGGPRVLNLATLECSPRMCVFHKCPGGADAAGLESLR